MERFRFRINYVCWSNSLPFLQFFSVYPAMGVAVYRWVLWLHCALSFSGAVYVFATGGRRVFVHVCVFVGLLPR